MRSQIAGITSRRLSDGRSAEAVASSAAALCDKNRSGVVDRLSKKYRRDLLVEDRFGVVLADEATLVEQVRGTGQVRRRRTMMQVLRTMTSRDPKDQGRDPNTSEAVYLDNRAG